MALVHADPRSSLPPRPPRFVPRPRLIAALDDAAPASLTLVSAGPGSGKTVLLSDWARSRSGRTAWLSLSPADNEPRRFWRMFLSALRASGAAQDDLPPGLPNGTAELLDSLYVHVPESESPAVLVLDDAHVLHNPDILEGLHTIVRLWHARLRLVVAARSDPLLPLPRYRLDGRLRELRAAQLAMTASEARDLLANHHVTLDEPAFETLLRRTEGWTAGLRLSALRMEGIPRPADFVAELAIDEGSVGEYLMDEVLAHQGPSVRRLLIETSFLPEVTGPLARHVTGIENASDILDQLARTNSFVVPVDREHTRFRYHHLMAEILRYLLHRHSPELNRELFERAAVWFEQHGETGEALRCYVRADDETAVASLLVHGGSAAAHVSGEDLRNTGIEQLVAGRGDDPRPVTPEVEAVRLMVAARAVDPDIGLRRVSAWRSALIDGQSDPDLVLTAGLAELRIALSAGAWSVMGEAASRLLEDPAGRASATPGLPASLTLARAVSLFWQGDVAPVAALLRDALKSAERDAAIQTQIDVLGMLAFTESSMARPLHATQTKARVLTLLDSAPGLTTPATLELSDALNAYVAADFDSMARVLRRLAAIGAAEPNAGVDGSVALLQSALLLGCGQVAEARGRLDSAAALGSTATGLIAMQRDAMLAGIETSLGRPNSALRVLDSYRATPLDDFVAVARAWAHVALGDLSTAEGCVRSVLTSTNASLARSTIVQALLCEAEIRRREGNEPGCVELLVRATEIAGGDIVLSFAAVADVFAEVLARHPTLSARWPVPPRSDSLAAKISVPVAAELPDPLTERERAVLRYLATSMSTAEIASELYLSVNTIKTHLAAIYRKLAASRRREAVLRARELELL